MNKNSLKKLFYYFFLISFLTSCMDPATYRQKTTAGSSTSDNFNNCLIKSGGAGMGASNQGGLAAYSTMAASLASCK